LFRIRRFYVKTNFTLPVYCEDDLSPPSDKSSDQQPPFRPQGSGSKKFVRPLSPTGSRATSLKAGLRIRINLSCRIRIQIADPDPGGQK
jgi:hypothetical protein